MKIQGKIKLDQEEKETVANVIHALLTKKNLH